MENIIRQQVNEYLNYLHRDVTRIRGFTREILNALVADIETREWRRCSIAGNHLSNEHPRVSTMDDCKCFFSILRDMVGKDFALKNVQFAWRHVCIEFTKRIDGDLPFFYFSSFHDHFFEGKRPGFNTPQESKASTCNPRVKRSETLVGQVVQRCTLPTPGAQSVRMKYHNVPIEVPPPPNQPSNLSDHYPGTICLVVLLVLQQVNHNFLYEFHQ